MENEIIVNDEVIESVEDVTTGTSGKGLLALGVAAATVAASYLLVSKVIVPAYKKLKAKKEAEKSEREYIVPDETFDSEEA